MKLSNLRKYFEKDLKWGKISVAKQRFNFLISASKFVKNGVILDAGAGFQPYKPFFDECIYISQEHKVGIDFKKMDNINYDLIGPMDEKILLKKSSVDAVLATEVLEHIKYPEKFLSEAFRVLKPGGKIFISVPFFYFEHEIPYDFNRYTRYGLKKILVDAGFVNLDIKPSSSCTFNILWFLPQAAVFDILKTSEEPKKLFLNILKEKGYIKAIYRLPQFVYAYLMYHGLKYFGRILNSLIDRGSYNKAIMPMEWFGVAIKPGKYTKPNRFMTKDKFLKAFKIND